MEEILRKIREQFPEARGIAIIGVDGNRTIDMECNCPQCQAERAEQQAKNNLKKLKHPMIYLNLKLEMLLKFLWWMLQKCV